MPDQKCYENEINNTTVTSEVEAVVNSRSFTYIYENEVEEMVTPSHLYCGR